VPERLIRHEVYFAPGGHCVAVPGGVADREASRGQYSQTVVVVGTDPDFDLGSGGHSAQPGAWVVEGEDLSPRQALPSGPVRAVLGHAPAVSPASSPNREAC
jgi:hypothetical protein